MKKIKIIKYHPFENGKTYQLKWSLGGEFTITNVVYSKKGIPNIKGIHSLYPELGVCPIDASILVPYSYEDGETIVCSKCGHELTLI
jgi:hypothetical protein